MTVTLPKDRLLIEAEHYGVLIDTPSMQTGLCAQPLSAAPLRLLTEGLFGVHQQTSPDLLGGWLERAVLNAFLDDYGVYGDIELLHLLLYLESLRSYASYGCAYSLRDFTAFLSLEFQRRIYHDDHRARARLKKEYCLYLRNIIS